MPIILENENAQRNLATAKANVALSKHIQWYIFLAEAILRI